MMSNDIGSELLDALRVQREPIPSLCDVLDHDLLTRRQSVVCGELSSFIGFATTQADSERL
jgi:hypothetical protein